MPKMQSSRQQSFVFTSKAECSWSSPGILESLANLRNVHWSPIKLDQMSNKALTMSCEAGNKLRLGWIYVSLPMYPPVLPIRRISHHPISQLCPTCCKSLQEFHTQNKRLSTSCQKVVIIDNFWVVRVVIVAVPFLTILRAKFLPKSCHCDNCTWQLWQPKSLGT